jgi:Stress up-regulated Nod 19
VNVPGDVVTAVGHVHGEGVAVEATNESQGGASICKSAATLDPADPHRVLSMSSCSGDPLARVREGETVRLHSMYESAEGADDVMAIILLYIRPT